MRPTTRLGSVRLSRTPVRYRLLARGQRLVYARDWLRLRRLGGNRPAEYREYLQTQLLVTLLQRTKNPGIGSRVLIDRIVQEGPGREASILCIGCRNGIELDEFRARGFENVVGIDLFSQRDDIRVMDMHELTFADDSFDVIYASHSLEHSYEVDKVVSEIARVATDGALVAVEVPVHGRPTDADLVVFSGVDTLRKMFHPYISEELSVEEQPGRTSRNDRVSGVARLVFRLQKDVG
jgi:SAM-dependent methyltransferase